MGQSAPRPPWPNRDTGLKIAFIKIEETIWKKLLSWQADRFSIATYSQSSLKIWNGLRGDGIDAGNDLAWVAVSPPIKPERMAKVSVLRHDSDSAAILTGYVASKRETQVHRFDKYVKNVTDILLGLIFSTAFLHETRLGRVRRGDP